jgi:DNA-binding CsgD family transcriptional regulator
MRRDELKSPELPTYAVLVNAAGKILDIRTHHTPVPALPPELKGSIYAKHCDPRYRKAIAELLTRDRQLLAAVMPPGTLEIDAWFAVVGVPLGTLKEGGALFVHLDITPWVASNGEAEEIPSEISMDLLHKAMVTTLIGSAPGRSARQAREHYDGVESLSPRQLEVLKLIGKGKSNAEIASDLSCSLNTVKRHVTAVLQKLKLPNRTRAAMLAAKIDLGSDAA